MERGTPRLNTQRTMTMEPNLSKSDVIVNFAFLFKLHLICQFATSCDSRVQDVAAPDLMRS